MGAHDGAVDHRVFVVRIDSQQREDTGPHTAFRPSAPTPMGVVSIAKMFGKIAPGDTGAVPVYHRVYEQAVIRGGNADGTRSPGQAVFDQIPLVIA
jgi:hypothetical protein